jgi:hypothetical protein
MIITEGYHVMFSISLALLKMHEDELLAAPDEGSAFMILREIPKRAFDFDKLQKVRAYACMCVSSRFV